MVDQGSTGLPECGPTESSDPEPCFSNVMESVINLSTEPFILSYNPFLTGIAV